MPEISINELEEALRGILNSVGLDHIELAEGFDHDGDSAVFITAVIAPNVPAPLPGEVSASASVAVAQAMHAAGDDRLSYLYIRRPDDERPEEEEASAASP